MIKVGSKIEEYNGEHALFASKDISKGTVVFVYTYPTSEAEVIKESNLIQLLNEGNEIAKLTGCRFLLDEFVMDKTLPDKLPKSYYINHSFNPNLLYHCGMGFALRDISKDEMLTMNYEYLLAQTALEEFEDWETGKTVKGLSGIESLTRSTEELLKLLWSLDD